jgi:hypothetical protein
MFTQELEPKLPSDRFKVTLPVLLEYLQVQDEANLPPIWHRWSNCTKKQEVQVLRDTLEAFARTGDAFSSSVPLVTPRLVQDLLEFAFISSSVDELKSGLHPFTLADGHSKHQQTNLETARLYGLLTAGDATVSLVDLESLQAKEIKSIPLSYWELEKTLGMFGNLISVLLGHTHPLTQAYKEMWILLQTNVKDDIHMVIEYRGYVKPSHILRSIQLGLYTWFMHRRSRLTPPSPDFKSILHNILMQTYILPNLPPQFYKLAYPKKHTATSATSSIPGTVSTASLSSSNPSDGSTVSGLTAPTLPTQLTGQSRGMAVINLQPNTALQALLPSNIKIKDLIGSTSPPEFDSGGEMCLSFLVRNQCWSNCKRASQHRAALNNVEQTRLEAYINTQKQAYSARRQQRTTVGGTPTPTAG